MFYLDGKLYNADFVINSFEQTADILNGDESGRLKGTKEMYMQYVGTFFNHSFKLVRNNKCSDTEWAKLFDALADPHNAHTMKLPYGINNKKITVKVYISQVKRKLVDTKSKNKWANTYEVAPVARTSNWLASGKLKGVE